MHNALRCLGSSLLALLVLVFPRTAGAGPKHSVSQASQIVCNRVAQLQGALTPQQRRFITVAVGMTIEGKVIIATSENDRPRLREAMEALILPGEEVITNQYKGKLHAEEKIVRRAGTSLYVVAASWSICESCEGQIRGVHATPVTVCRSEAGSRRSKKKPADEPEEPPPEEEPQEDAEQ